MLYWYSQIVFEKECRLCTPKWRLKRCACSTVTIFPPHWHSTLSDHVYSIGVVQNQRVFKATFKDGLSVGTAWFLSTGFSTENACCFQTHLSNEKKPGWLGYIGDEILPSYILLTNQYFMESIRGFFSWLTKLF